LKEIPDHLILQLKRFEFDLGYQRRSKINDLFEFPMSVDMSKYTFKYLSNPTQPIAVDMFDLVGVIVHRGHADHGHYVSYIRARPTLPNQPPLWLQFDDQDVSTFKPQDIAEACYGGMPTNKDNQYTSYSPGPKLYNAYMLFYQRQSTIDEQSWPQPTNTSDPRHVSLPRALERTVEEENSSILEQYCLFDQPHRDLVLTLLSKLERMNHVDDEMKEHKHHKTIIEITLEYISTVWARTKELPDFETAMIKLKAICTRCHFCSYLVIAWFSEPSGNELRDLILRSTQAKVRQHIRSLIMTCLEALRHDAQMYGADVNEEAPNSTGNGASTIITKLAGFAPQDLGYNGRAWEEYWGLLSDIAMLGAQECWIMIEEGILLVCIELFMYNWDPKLQTTYARVADMYRRRPQPPPPNNLIWLIAHLFERIDFNIEPDYMSSERRLRAFDPTTGLVPLLSEEYEMLMEYNGKEFSLVWLSDLFEKWDSNKEGTNDFAPGEIIRYLMSNHGTLARNVAHTLQSNIEQYETQFSDPCMRATCYILQYSRNKDIIREMTAFMAKTSKKANPANDSEGYNGEMCLRYFHSLFRVSVNDLNKHIRDPAFFWKQYLQHIDTWAPYLLTFEKTYKIGIDTYQLLKESLFKDVALVEVMEEKDVSLEKRRAIAVRKLFKGCAGRAQDVLQSETTKAAVYPIICAMRECQEYLVLLSLQDSEFANEIKDVGDEGIIEQYDGKFARLVADHQPPTNPFTAGYKQVFDTLPTLGPDDDLSRSGELGNGGTEWEDLDLVDDVEASELTDVEGSDDELAG
jgi:ubiquitin carboxyl-terminal hydrolase 34